MFLHARTLSDLRRFTVAKGCVKAYSDDSGRRIFFEGGSCFTYKKPPQDLSLRDFIDLNPFDFEELKAFQEEFGLITSPYRDLPNSPSIFLNFDHITSNLILNYFEDEINACNTSYQMWLEYCNELKGRHDGANLSFKNMGNWPEEETFPVTANYSSMDEVSQTVSNIQRMIKATSAVKMGSYSENDEDMAYLFPRIASSLVEHGSPYFEYVDDDCLDNDPYSPNRCVPLTEALIVDHAFNLADDEVFKTCENPECGRIFQYKKGGKRTNSAYCCDECQVRAKRLRQYEREKEQRKQKRISMEEEDNG